MKRSTFIKLIAFALLLGLGWLVPHSLFKVTMETSSTPAPVSIHAQPPAPTDIPAISSTPIDIPTPVGDPYGELYFTIITPKVYTPPAEPPIGVDESTYRLVRLPGSCIVGQEACPEVETVQTPFNMKDVFTNLPKGIAWSHDGKFGALAIHPQDELSHGRTMEEMNQLQTQSPADFQVATSTIYLFDAETEAWQEVYHADRKFIYTPVWSIDGQWLAFAMKSSVWAFHPLQPEDGIYVVHPDGSGLKQLGAVDATILGWVGNSVFVQRTINPYPATDYAFEMLTLDRQITSLFTSTRMAYYNPAPDGGALLVTDAQGGNSGSSQKSVDLLALDGSITHTFGTYSNMTQSIWATAWSDDSSMIAYANLRRVYVAPCDGDPREVYLADDTYVEPSILNIQFSPDQKSLLLHVNDGMPKLVVVSLESGQSTELNWEGMKSEEQATHFSWRP
jgi:hypothetical protein